ncbi:MAG: helix-turn-helix domain-containing protein [Clostridiaceae bacterium]|nr:helix-turn-helix domain-containing protein [Clostridiaceae bacterium]
MYKALIVDDEKPIMKVITALGEWSKYGIERPYYAGDGKEGLAAMREISPDIVFVDMKMPVIDGPAFLKATTNEYPDTQYIVISGHSEFEFARTALKYRVLDYLLKPIIEEELNAVLKKATELLSSNKNTDSGTANTEVVLNIDEIVFLIKTHIEKNYSRDIALQMFAEQYHFSKEYLSKVFKEKFGKGIYEYAMGLRMGRARELLIDMDMPIHEISERLGYKDSSYFSKAFRNYFGCWPTEFRRNPQ